MDNICKKCGLTKWTVGNNGPFVGDCTCRRPDGNFDLTDAEAQAGRMAQLQFERQLKLEGMGYPAKYAGGLSSFLGDSGALAALDEWPHKKRWLLIHGSMNTGKSHLAWGAVQQAVFSGASAKYALADQIVRSITTAGFGNNEAIAEKWHSPWRLIIDELGAETRKANASDSELFSMLELRCQELRPVLAFSNDSPNKLASLSDNYAKIISRFERLGGFYKIKDTRTGEHNNSHRGAKD